MAGYKNKPKVGTPSTRGMRTPLKERRARVEQAKTKVRGLVRSGYRLNPAKASTTYKMAVADLGTPKERRVASASMDAAARGKVKVR